MLETTVYPTTIQIGKHFSVSFQRTLRLPDDGKVYPLPPGLGAFPICRVEEYADRVPATWREHGGVFIPMYQREALWLQFRGASWRPNAVKIGVGKVNAVTGQPWSETLHAKPQDYLICPNQPWLDGIKTGDGVIRQFVAMPLGMGYTVEGQVTGQEEFGGIQLLVVEPKPGRFPDEPPPEVFRQGVVMAMAAPSAPAGGTEMGLGAGGQMQQKIYPDPYGLDSWDETSTGQLYVHIVNSMAYREITGQEPPPTPISAQQYTQYGFPWFSLYDEDQKDVDPSAVLAEVKSIKEMDQTQGFAPQQDDSSVEIAETQVKPIPPQSGSPAKE